MAEDKGNKNPGWRALMTRLAEFYSGMTDVLGRSVEYGLIEDGERLALYLSILKSECANLAGEVMSSDYQAMSDEEKELDMIAKYLLSVSMAFLHLRAIYGDDLTGAVLLSMGEGDDGEEDDGEMTEISPEEARERFLKEYMEAYSKQDTEFLSMSVDEWLQENRLTLGGGRRSDSGPAPSDDRSGRDARKPSGARRGRRRLPAGSDSGSGK